MLALSSRFHGKSVVAVCRAQNRTQLAHKLAHFCGRTADDKRRKRPLS